MQVLSAKMRNRFLFQTEENPMLIFQTFKNIYELINIPKISKKWQVKFLPTPVDSGGLKEYWDHLLSA